VSDQDPLGFKVTALEPPADPYLALRRDSRGDARDSPG